MATLPREEWPAVAAIILKPHNAGRGKFFDVCKIGRYDKEQKCRVFKSSTDTL